MTPTKPSRGLFLVDIDGTVALRRPGPRERAPYDWHRVGEDLPNAPVITVVQALAAAGHGIIYVTGRSDACRASTRAWLAEHVAVPGEALLMRKDGDRRRDTTVKSELYKRHVRPNEQVTAVLEDRATVVAMWRGLGLTVLQVADGDF
ncbi:phosphatase domain-containing protein [Actinomadura harenae]|uniref:Polynucleotide kinase n=1 Tax=Actinomadura harenae TaxID=2483351 RepID=A0A3M2LX03_9ACTN|nr:polynucleotide kinase [Actinomadura harenae]RMI41083.1 polynucleotide kinase [Actinomadura harenae]